MVSVYENGIELSAIGDCLRLELDVFNYTLSTEHCGYRLGAKESLFKKEETNMKPRSGMNYWESIRIRVAGKIYRPFGRKKDEQTSTKEKARNTSGTT